MSHVMIPEGLDHCYETCPAFKAERRQFPKSEPSVGPDYDWQPEKYPDGSRPFGLCGWCWRIYVAREGKRR